MRNSIDKDTAKTNFEANVSKKVQAKYLKQGNNNYIQAYKIWMYEMVFLIPNSLKIHLSME